MAGKKNEWDFVIDLAKIFQSGQMKESIDQLGQNIQSLNNQLSTLNVQIITQNNQVNESIKQTKEHTEGLRKEFEKLNQEMTKSSSFFERLDKSSRAMENVTWVIAGLTVYLLAMAFYSMFKNDYGIAKEVSFISGVLLALLTLIFFRFLFTRIDLSKLTKE